MVHLDLIGTYSNYIIQQHPDSAIIKNNVSLICMTMPDPAMCWFEIVEVSTYDLDEVTGGSDE